MDTSKTKGNLMGGGVFMEAKRKKKFEPSFKREAVRLAEGPGKRNSRNSRKFQGQVFTLLFFEHRIG